MIMYYAKPPVNIWIMNLNQWERQEYLDKYREYDKPLYKAYCDEWGEE